jgi:GDPmannose 4,6-dehydratase
MGKILISGISGMLGSILADKLVPNNEVWGLKRRTSTNTLSNLGGVINNPHFHLIEGDVTDPLSVSKIVREGQFDQIYHCAAQSFVKASFYQPAYTMQSIYNSTLYFLDAIKDFSAKTRFLHMSSSEMFGANYSLDNGRKFQNEDTPFAPQSPYGCAKLAAHNLVRIYRKAYNLFCCSAIAFNMEGPRRGSEFVTQKIAQYVAKQHHAGPFIEKLRLGNLNIVRDWNYVGDSADAIIKMLQFTIPTDLVIARGVPHTIEDFLRTAFSQIGVTDYLKYVEIDNQLRRPLDVDYLCGDATRAEAILGYKPETSFSELVKMMVDAAIKNYRE